MRFTKGLQDAHRASSSASRRWTAGAVLAALALAAVAAPALRQALAPHATLTALVTDLSRARTGTPLVVASADAQAAPAAAPKVTDIAVPMPKLDEAQRLAATQPAPAPAPDKQAPTPAASAVPPASSALQPDPAPGPAAGPQQAVAAVQPPAQPAAPSPPPAVAPVPASLPTVTIAMQPPPLLPPAVNPCLAEVAALARQQTVWFATGSARLAAEDLGRIEDFARRITTCPGARIEVSGHTDAQGIDATNFQLSWQRAEAVIAHLQSRRIDTANFEAVGFGTKRPLVPGSISASAQSGLDADVSRQFARNRRVEFTLR